MKTHKLQINGCLHPLQSTHFSSAAAVSAPPYLACLNSQGSHHGCMTQPKEMKSSRSANSQLKPLQVSFPTCIHLLAWALYLVAEVLISGDRHLCYISQTILTDALAVVRLLSFYLLRQGHFAQEGRKRNKNSESCLFFFSWKKTTATKNNRQKLCKMQQFP